MSILNEVAPGAEVVVWSDMFDPFHNAVNDYYLVNGTLDGSWEGSAKAGGGGELERRARSGRAWSFSPKRGNRQVIAGYYDGDDLSNFESWDSGGAQVFPEWKASCTRRGSVGSICWRSMAGRCGVGIDEVGGSDLWWVYKDVSNTRSREAPAS